MSEKKIKEQQGNRQILLENPYDLETIFESMSIASKYEKELIFVDKLIAYIRLDPEIEITEICYNILRELDLLQLENKELE